MNVSLPKPLEQRLNGLATQVRHGPVGQFFAWWRDELVALLPESWRSRLGHQRSKLLVRRVGPEIEVNVESGGDIQMLDALSMDQDVELQQQQVRDLLFERELLEVPRHALLSADDVLINTVNLPIAAESNLHQALAFDMDRQTPFRAEDVYFDYRVLERNRDTGQLTIEMVVAPKPVVDNLVESLVLRGLSPTSVDMRSTLAESDGEWLEAGFNLLPPERRFRPPNRQLRLNAMLAAAVLVMLVVVMFQSLAWREHQVEQLDEAIAAVRDEATRVTRIREQISDAAEAAGFLQARRAESAPVVRVLAEVTRVLPDDTFLERLALADGGVQMQGKSSDAQSLIERVNQSPMLDDASFQGPTRLDNRSGKEVFDLSAVVLPGVPMPPAETADNDGQPEPDVEPPDATPEDPPEDADAVAP